MTAEPDLLPCPFCGSVEPIVAEHPEMLPPSFRVICSGGVCHAVVEGRTLVRAKLMWNRRANVAHATAPLQAEVEALRAEVDAAELRALRAITTAATFKELACEHRARAQRAEAQAAELAEALEVARQYVQTELACEKEKFEGYMHCSTASSIEADLQQIDAALSRAANDTQAGGGGEEGA